MYSQEFMRYLIKYQTPDYDESVNKKTKYLGFGFRTKLASVLLVNKK